MIVKTSVQNIKLNPSNPREIKPEKFSKLVKSIKDAPWMLKLRPIVVNRDGVIIGGNQRYKACLEAGLDEVWVIWADQISEQQQRSFIIRDNVDFGVWDLEILKRQYSQNELLEYGAEIQLLQNLPAESDHSVKPPVPMGEDDAVEPNISEEELEQSKKNFNDNTIKQIIFQFPSEVYENVLRDLNEISMKMDCDDNSEVFLRLINFYEFSNELSDPDNDPLEGESRED